ncbi:transposase [Streptomyces zinciresistens K42]|uniref:Transposase n=1 Tax=Streptomyces zinciresistens K42 TaxID=700597 RepID=G2G5V2_9ACTN|nr:transposase [Streptomyces zinciresistens K42]
MADEVPRLSGRLVLPGGGRLTIIEPVGEGAADDGFRHPVKRPQGGELATGQQTFNRVIRGIHGVAERANALLKVTF